jgi:hypothetical protein
MSVLVSYLRTYGEVFFNLTPRKLRIQIEVTHCILSHSILRIDLMFTFKDTPF